MAAPRPRGARRGSPLRPLRSRLLALALALALALTLETVALAAAPSAATAATAATAAVVTVVTYHKCSRMEANLNQPAPLLVQNVWSR